MGVGCRIYAGTANIFCFFLYILHEAMSCIPMRKRGGKQIKRASGVGFPTPDARILHPILHPKSLESTIGFAYGCRKCRRFSKTFFFCAFRHDVYALRRIHGTQRSKWSSRGVPKTSDVPQLLSSKRSQICPLSTRRTTRSVYRSSPSGSYFLLRLRPKIKLMP